MGGSSKLEPLQRHRLPAMGTMADARSEDGNQSVKKILTCPIKKYCCACVEHEYCTPYTCVLLLGDRRVMRRQLTYRICATRGLDH